MSQTRNRLVIQVVLVLAVIGFIGISLAPLIDAINKPTPEKKLTQDSKLEDEARGLDLVLQREPNNQAALKSLLEARLLLYKQGKANIKEVIEPLEKLAKLNPDKTEYTVLLAQAKLSAGDHEGAAAAYRSILQTKPGDIKALQGMVALLLNQKRPEAAIGLLQETLSTTAPKANKIQPGSVDTTAVKVMLGNVYASQKRNAQAFAVYDEAIMKDPQDFRPVLAKAMLLKTQGKIDEAKPLFTKATTLAPANYKDQINQLSSGSPTPTVNTTPKQ